VSEPTAVQIQVLVLEAMRARDAQQQRNCTRDIALAVNSILLGIVDNGNRYR
jgi:hypothetical protein